MSGQSLPVRGWTPKPSTSRCRLKVLGGRVYGLGLGVKGLGLRVYGFRFGV